MFVVTNEHDCGTPVAVFAEGTCIEKLNKLYPEEGGYLITDICISTENTLDELIAESENSDLPY